MLKASENQPMRPTGSQGDIEARDVGPGLIASQTTAEDRTSTSMRRLAKGDPPPILLERCSEVPFPQETASRVKCADCGAVCWLYDEDRHAWLELGGVCEACAVRR
jgi:hypothetical protein